MGVIDPYRRTSAGRPADFVAYRQSNECSLSHHKMRLHPYFRANRGLSGAEKNGSTGKAGVSPVTSNDGGRAPGNSLQRVNHALDQDEPGSGRGLDRCRGLANQSPLDRGKLGRGVVARRLRTGLAPAAATIDQLTATARQSGRTFWISRPGVDVIVRSEPAGLFRLAFIALICHVRGNCILPEASQ